MVLSLGRQNVQKVRQLDMAIYHYDIEEYNLYIMEIITSLEERFTFMSFLLDHVPKAQMKFWYWAYKWESDQGKQDETENQWQRRKMHPRRTFSSYHWFGEHITCCNLIMSSNLEALNCELDQLTFSLNSRHTHWV